MHRRTFLISSAAALIRPAFAQRPTPSLPKKGRTRDVAKRAKVVAAIEKGIGFLDGQQKFEGWWTSPDFPGLTALIVQAYLAVPSRKYDGSSAVHRGLEFIRSNAKPDGGIYGQRMANYNTSICLATLLRKGDRRDGPLIRPKPRHHLLLARPLVSRRSALRVPWPENFRVAEPNGGSRRS